MALTIPGIKDTFEVVSHLDDSLDMTEEEFKTYMQTYNKAALKFFPGKEPVVFVMRKVIPFSQVNNVQSKQRRVVKGEVEVDLAFMNFEVKASLVDILNGGESLKFSKDSDGSASEKLMELLINAGIADELFMARKIVCKDQTGSLRKK